MKFNFILFFIFLLSFVSRTYKLDKMPPGLSADEAYLGYQAYSIIESGRDEWGVKFPKLVFRGYGEYKPPFHLYLVSASVRMFGLRPLSIRLPTALSGSLTVLATYLMVYQLWGRRDLALWSALLLAISPWHLSFSRHAYESTIAVFFTVMQVWSFLKAKKNSKYFYLSFFFLILALYTYHSNRILNPLLMFLQMVIFKETIKCLHFKKAFVGALLLSLPVVFSVLSVSGQARFKQTLLTNKFPLIDLVQKERNDCWPIFGQKMCLLLSNKYQMILSEYTKNYLDHFNTAILFVNGTYLNRHTTPDVGLMYRFVFPFFGIGLVTLLMKEKKTGWLILGWLAFYPLASSFSGVGELTRMQTVMPVLSIITAWGVVVIVKYISDRFKKSDISFLTYSVVIGLLLWSFANYSLDYWVTFPKDYYRYFNYGYPELVEKLSSDEIPQRYDSIIILKGYGVPQHHLAFELPFEPNIYTRDNVKHEQSSEGFYNLSQVGKYYFGSFEDFRRMLNNFELDRTLVVTNWNVGELFLPDSPREFGVYSPKQEMIFEAASAEYLKDISQGGLQG